MVLLLLHKQYIILYQYIYTYVYSVLYTHTVLYIRDTLPTHTAGYVLVHSVCTYCTYVFYVHYRNVIRLIENITPIVRTSLLIVLTFDLGLLLSLLIVIADSSATKWTPNFPDKDRKLNEISFSVFSRFAFRFLLFAGDKGY